MSMHPHMGWGLFALQAPKAEDELLSFVGQSFKKNKVKKYVQGNP